MKVLFIVQGEGRGHLTQAITLEEILRRNGHEVVEVLGGKEQYPSPAGFLQPQHTGTCETLYSVRTFCLRLPISGSACLAVSHII